MAKKAKQPYQYEPLVTPAGWRGDELRYAIRLTQLIDDLYQKQSKLREENRALKKRLDALEGSHAEI